MLNDQPLWFTLITFLSVNTDGTGFGYHNRYSPDTPLQGRRIAPSFSALSIAPPFSCKYLAPPLSARSRFSHYDRPYFPSFGALTIVLCNLSHCAPVTPFVIRSALISSVGR